MAEPQYAPQLANPFLDPGAAAAPTQLSFQGSACASSPRAPRAQARSRDARPQPRAGLPGWRWTYRPERKFGCVALVLCFVRLWPPSDAGAGFSQPPGLSYRVPDSAPPLQSTAFPSVPAAQPPAPSGGSGGYFSLKSYAVYFDVDTADVLHRMRLACVPFGSSFMTTVQDKPDL